MSTAHSILPPLREGDRLTPDEFLRRWEAMPELKRAELIDGIVYMPSPLGPVHAKGDGLIASWMGYYALFTPGCEMLLNGTWRMSRNSVPQPDVALRIAPEYGGRALDETNWV